MKWCFWPPGECEAHIHSFQLVFGLHQLLWKKSGSLVARRATLFTSWSLTLSASHYVLGTVGLGLLETMVMKVVESHTVNVLTKKHVLKVAKKVPIDESGNRFSLF